MDTKHAFDDIRAHFTRRPLFAEMTDELRVMSQHVEPPPTPPTRFPPFDVDASSAPSSWVPSPAHTFAQSWLPPPIVRPAAVEALLSHAAVPLHAAVNGRSKSPNRHVIPNRGVPRRPRRVALGESVSSSGSEKWEASGVGVTDRVRSRYCFGHRAVCRSRTPPSASSPDAAESVRHAPDDLAHAMREIDEAGVLQHVRHALQLHRHREEEVETEAIATNGVESAKPIEENAEQMLHAPPELESHPLAAAHGALWRDLNELERTSEEVVQVLSKTPARLRREGEIGAKAPNPSPHWVMTQPVKATELDDRQPLDLTDIVASTKALYVPTDIRHWDAAHAPRFEARPNTLLRDPRTSAPLPYDAKKKWMHVSFA